MEKVIPSKNKLLGLLYGHAIGAGIGSQYKFKKATDLSAVNSSDIKLIAWSPASEMMFLLIDAIVNNTECEKALVDWRKENIVVNMRNIIKCLLDEEDYVYNPAAVTRRLWEKSDKKLANNINLFCTPAAVVTGTAYKTELVSCDPRCYSCDEFYGNVIKSLLYNDDINPYIVYKESEVLSYNKLKHITHDEFSDQCKLEEYCKDFDYWIRLGISGDLIKTNIDDMTNTDYVYKTTAFSALVLKVIDMSKKINAVPSFEKSIIKVLKLGGDTESNCAIVGALLGCYLGYSNLPLKWLNNPFDKIINKLCDNIIHYNKNQTISSEPASSTESSTELPSSEPAETSTELPSSESAETSTELPPIENSLEVSLEDASLGTPEQSTDKFTEALRDLGLESLDD